MPPVIDFGSPVQRQKDEAECHYHVPIKIFPRLKIGPATLGGCWIYMDRYEGDEIIDKIRLCWGDTAFEPVSNATALINGQVALVPIVWRSENNNERRAFITDMRFFDKKEKYYPLLPDRAKHRFKLRVKCGKFERTSDHFYLIRVPVGTSNGHFTVEIEYEGEGSRGKPYVTRQISEPRRSP